MAESFFCTRCGLGGLIGHKGRTVCERCRHAFTVPAAVPPPLRPAALANAEGAGNRPLLPAGATAYDIWTAVLLYLFMPVGLVMLWTHPTWSQRRKVIITCVAAAVIVVPTLLGMLMLVLYAVSGGLR